VFGASIGRGSQRIIDAMVRGLARGHINPNLLSITWSSVWFWPLLLGRHCSDCSQSL
jgi:hypothetical protein